MHTHANTHTYFTIFTISQKLGNGRSYFLYVLKAKKKKKTRVKTKKKTNKKYPLFQHAVKTLSSAETETEEKERLSTERESRSVDRPGGPYPPSLHGHYTDLKGKT